MADRREVYRFHDFKWDGVETEDYKKAEPGKPVSFSNVKKQVICPGGPDVCFEARYFEIGKDGYTTLEKHDHVHYVTILRGRGRIIIGERVFDATPFDAFVIRPWSPHQLTNTEEEPLGFFCTVNASRDDYQLLSAEELGRLMDIDEVRAAARVPEAYLNII